LIAVAFFFPGAANAVLEGILELLVQAFLCKVTLHVGDVGMVATEALVFVEDPQEDVEYGVACVVGAGLAVDIEQDDVGWGVGSFLHVCADHGVAQLALVKETIRLAWVALGVVGLDVGQQVGKDFQKVGFTRAEEAGNPDADPVGNGWVVQPGIIGFEEVAEVTFQLVGDDVFVKLLEDRGFVGLIGLYDAVDRPVQLFEENIL